MSNVKNCSNANKVSVRHEYLLTKKNYLMYVTIISTAVLIQACSGNYKEDAKYMSQENAVADSVKAYAAGIATDTINGNTHNFIRNANLKCKVKDVLNSTKQIEDIVSNNGGYVTLSDLTSNSNYNNSIQIKKDSVLELNYFTTTCNISIRVPNKQLDTVIRKITDMAVFIDYRTLKADDVKLKLYSNKLTENRYADYNKSLKTSVATKNAKLNQENDAHENVLQKQTLADEKSVESIDLADQVNYSTVHLQLYQAQSSISEIKALPPVYKNYEPSFLSKLGNSFVNGFKLLKNLILFFVDIWGIVLIIIFLFFGIKKAIMYFSKKTASI